MCDIGLIGLAVMGENLILNMESKGFKVACFNRTTSKVRAFTDGRAKNKQIVGCYTVQELCDSLATPRKVMIMVRAGKPVDLTIDSLLPFLEVGDIIIDGGNSNYQDTTRRAAKVEAKGLLYIGAGVSGGEEGALKGPSIMPGGSPQAWTAVKPIFQSISAKVEGGAPCCEYVGGGGSGHFVKMVHNGIEYGDMQLISEAYFLMKNYLGMTNEEMADTFEAWNKSELDSYLIEITRDILRKKEENNDTYVLDCILDAAGQKGTGKWTVINGLELGYPVTLIAEATFARTLSYNKKERVKASSILAGPHPSKKISKEERDQFLLQLKASVYASKLVSYAQGFALLRQAASEFKWELNYGGIALMWRGGCIIRSRFLGKIKDAFDKDPTLTNLLLSPFFVSVVSNDENQKSWRKVIATAVTEGFPLPAMCAALSYYDGLRASRGSANMIQAQRDYFGAHTYERVDKPRGEVFHTNWTGRGGSTASSTYIV